MGRASMLLHIDGNANGIQYPAHRHPEIPHADHRFREEYIPAMTNLAALPLLVQA